MLIGMIKWMHLSMEISFFKNDISMETNMKSVSVPPVTSFSPAEASPTVLEGGSYNVTCLVSANPPAQVLSLCHHIIIQMGIQCHMPCVIIGISYSHTYLTAATMSSCHHQTTCRSCPANPPSGPKHRKCRHLA